MAAGFRLAAPNASTTIYSTRDDWVMRFGRLISTYPMSTTHLAGNRLKSMGLEILRKCMLWSIKHPSCYLIGEGLASQVTICNKSGVTERSFIN